MKSEDVARELVRIAKELTGKYTSKEAALETLENIEFFVDRYKSVLKNTPLKIPGILRKHHEDFEREVLLLSLYMEDYWESIEGDE